MSPFVPDNIIDQILDRCDIVEIISSYIPLKKAGRSYKALCPFHHEKTPSFIVNPEKGIFHCFGCFPPGSLIKTKEGFHKIEDVPVGQLVLTHRGRFMPVIRTLWRPYNGTTIEIYTRKSNLPVTLTADHEVFVIKTRNCKYRSRRNKICQWRCKLNCSAKFFNEYRIEKLPAAQLSLNDYLLFPINQKINDLEVIDLDRYYNRKVSNYGPEIRSILTKIKLDENFLRLIGYWIAEGSNHRAYIRFSLGGGEGKFAKEIKELVEFIFHIQASIHTRKKSDKTGLEISACNSKLSNIFENLCGKGAENKHIPFEFQNLPLKKQEVILNAIFKGDGYIGKVSKCKENRKFKRITTVSLVLAEQLKDILLRSGISPTFRRAHAKVDKKNVNHKTAYTLLWQDDIKLHFSDIIQRDGVSYQILPIRKIAKKGFRGEVYNLTVAKDHSYATPNFVVGNCGVGGNVFSFIMKYERLEFPEVLRMLAKKTGVALPELKRKDADETASLINELYRIHEYATAYFQNMLLAPSAKRPRDYLAERGIQRETAARFRLGFAADAWDGLFSYLKRKGFKDGLIEKSGLIIPRSEGSGYYDRFRNRLIFPIFDQRDKVIAFAGRVLDDSLPKYMNSPETQIYSKARTLYGLNAAKKDINEKDTAVIVEGYTDLLIPYQSGMKNIIASCGTALTAEHIRILKRHSRNVIMVYDSDKAGELATLRGLDLLLEEDMHVGIAQLPEGFDPDSFVRKYGIEAFQELTARPTPLFEYKLNLLASLHGEGTIESKIKIANEMLSTISRVNNDILKSEYIKRLAESLGLDENALRLEAKKIKRDYASSYSIDTSLIERGEVAPLSAADKIIVRLMVEDSNLIAFVKERLGCDEFSNKLTRKIIESIFRSHEENKPISYRSLITQLNIDGVENILSDMAAAQFALSDKRRNLEDCVSWIKKDNMKRNLDELRNQIKEAQDREEHNRVTELVARYNRLIKEGSRGSNSRLSLQN